ncbi:uncharacterized protein [Nicotiana tomentosiformis]|uniref:uncharacterized protein isoform X2 n=1 Tax=Nicotiana tomentosiformis TaxID=4098 RepID=UPI000877EC24
MFKSSKWKKEKIKAVFRMQFQVTQVPQLKAKKLMISLVPADAGKPTVRLGKAAIVEGTCSWENPIYETVKLVRDPKTGQIKQNIYYFAVASGSSKSGFLGEVGLDFADLVEATETLVVSLPLMPLETGAILHGENLNEPSHYLKKNSVPWDPQPKNSFVKQFTPQNAVNPLERHLHHRSSTDCSLGSDLDGSLIDTTYKSEEDLLRDNARETSSNSFESMKNKITMLERQAELSEIELQTLRKQTGKETKRAQEQSRHIANLKEERDVLKTECEKLRLRCTDEVDAVVSDSIESDDKSSTALLEEIRHKLQNEKNLNNKLMLKLQKTEDSNSELILTVRDLNKMLDQKDKDILYLSEKVRSNKDLLEAAAESNHLKIGQNEDRKAKELKIADVSPAMKQTIEKLQNEIEVYKKDNEELKAQMDQLESHCQLLKEENDDINHNLEQCEQQKVKTQQEHSQSLAAVKHFKLQVERLEEEMKRQTFQYSKSLDTINELETNVSTLENELETKTQEFEEHLEAVTQAKVKQEQRAVKAEEALRRARWSNAKAAQKLQGELKRLSDEMTLKIDEREKLASDAVIEANILREENKILEELLQKSEEEFKSAKDHYEREVLELKASSMEVGRPNAQQMEKSTAEMEIEQKLTKEKELERELASERREAEMFLEELIPLRTEVDQKKNVEETLQSEVEKLQLQNDEMRCSTDQLKLENENLMKLVLKLQGHRQEKEEEDEPPEEATPDIIVAGGRNCIRENIHHQQDAFTEERFVENGPSKIANITSREVDPGRASETINGHTQNILDPELLCEVALLKEKNNYMEHELKEMEERYSEISLKFAEVEGERQQLVMALRNLKNGKR